MGETIEVTVGFSRPKYAYKWFPIGSWLIRLFEWRPYSHVYVKWFADGPGVSIVYEASGTMVHFLSAKLFEERVETVRTYRIDLSREEYREMLRFCLTYAGYDYGKAQLVGIVAARLCGWAAKAVNAVLGTSFRTHFHNPLENGTAAWVCSEVFVRMFPAARVYLDPDTAGPKHVEAFLAQYPRARRTK